MSSKLVVITLLGAGTIAAAAAGGYTALRQNASDPQPVTLQTDVAVPPAAPAAAPPATPVVLDAETPAPPAKPSPVPVARPRKSAPRTPPRTVEAASPVTADPPREAPEAPAPVTPLPSDAPKAETAEVRYEPAAQPVAPAAPAIEELTIARDAVIGIRLESAVSSQTARVEDKVTARVARDVSVGGRTAISAGSRLEGIVSSVDTGGKFKDRARIGIRFNTLVLADNTRLPIDTETIFRESDSPTVQAATKVGASAAIGGILGAVFGGKKGAAIGSTVGAAGGAATVAAGSGPDATLSAGTPLTLRLTSPLTLTVQRDEE